MSDLISRQDAKYTFQQVCYGIQCQYCQAKEEDGTCRFEKWIDNLPSIQTDCEGCRWEDKMGGACDRCKRAYADRYEVKKNDTIGKTVKGRREE